MRSVFGHRPKTKPNKNPLGISSHGRPKTEERLQPHASLTGRTIDATIERTKTPPTTASDNGDEIWKNGATTILKPMKVKMMANPYLRRLNMCMKFANKKYMERKPNIANMFDV